MSYIKIKKIWLKKFSKEEAEIIFETFKRLSPVPAKEWKSIDFVEAIAKYGQFVHPETDIEDDSEGIKPKEIKKLLEYCKSMDNLVYFLEKIIPIFNRAALENKFSGYVSDGFISWSLVFNQHLEPFLKESTDLNLVIGKIIISFSPIFSSFVEIEQEVIRRIGANLISEQDIIDAQKTNLISRNQKTLLLSQINLEGYFEERKILWKEITGIIPQSDEMLRVNPSNFNKKIIDVVNEFFGTRQIGKLEPNLQKWVSLLIDNFALNLSIIPEELIKNISINSLSFGNGLVKDFSLCLRKVLETDSKLSLSNIKILLNSLHKYHHLEDYINKKQKLNENDINVILFIGNMFNQMNDEKLVESFQSIKPKYFNIFYRYRVQEYAEIKRLVKLFESAKDIKTTIPLIKGEVGKYEYEIIEKDNPIGLILGYATDCCQVIGGAGENCLIHGYVKPYSSFFVVKKDDKIYAQSWIWEKDTKEGKGLCFDSLEVLGKNLNKSKDVLNCYKDAAKQLMERYDIVYVGADGNQMPEGLEDAGDRWDVSKLKEKNMLYPDNNIYSDLNTDGAIILSTSKKNKKD